MGIWDFFAWFFWFYVAIACLWIFVNCFVDVFRDETLNGLAKALWVLFFVFVPFLGCIVYLIARHGSMAARKARGQEYVSESSGLI